MTDDDLTALAAGLYADWLGLKHTLVRTRRTLHGDRDAFLRRIGWDPDRLARFEEYDHDPRVSEVREYALAVGVRISTTCTPCDPPAGRDDA